MSNILNLILSLVWRANSLKRDVDILENNEKEVSNQENEKWEDFIKNDEKDK